MLAVDIQVKGDFGGFLESEIDALSQRFAEEIVVQARRIVDEGRPSGRLYRRRAITKRASKGLLSMGLKRRGRTRVYAGSEFHRASASGQAWAKDSGRAYRDIKVSRTRRGTYRVRFGAPYIGYLEFTLNRPVVLPAIQAAAEKIFNQ